MKKQPYIISEVFCWCCGKRWICARPFDVQLKDIECEECGKGYVFETGEIIRDTKVVEDE